MEDKLSDSEKMSYILNWEAKIMQAIMKGHKAAENDEFSEIRSTIRQYRIDLGIIKEEAPKCKRNVKNVEFKKDLSNKPE